MLYYLDSQEKTKLAPVKEIALSDIGWKEIDLEDLLGKHIDKVVRADQLFVIARERRMQEEADIMALDALGTLFLFELKRWRSGEDNLLQVLRYGQRFGQYEYERLDNYFQSYRRRHSAADDTLTLQEAHGQRFDLDPPRGKDEFNKKQRFVIVTNGLDTATWDAIEYWKEYKLPVEALVYRIYREEQSGRALIDFDPFGPIPSSPNMGDEGLFVVNTNKTYDPNAFRDMLDKDKVATYADSKHAITAVPKGADVCLYHTGLGVIAIGKAKGGYRTAGYHGDPDGEFFVPCEFEYKVYPDQEPNKAVPAWEINQEFGTGHRFRLPVFTLPAEFGAFIRKRLKERAEQ